MKKVLLVDDKEKERNAVREALINEYQVMAAGSADEAIALMKKETPDIVILDMRLPGHGSVKILRVLKGIDGAIPVIALSHRNAAGSIVGILRQGICDYFDAPLEITELKESIGRIAGRPSCGEKGGDPVLPVDLESFIESAVNATIDQSLVLDHALQRFREEYIDFIVSKYEKAV